jgi:hypothetical protein
MRLAGLDGPLDVTKALAFTPAAVRGHSFADAVEGML